MEVYSIYPGLDHIANFLNTIDTEGITALELKKMIYKECMTANDEVRVLCAAQRLAIFHGAEHWESLTLSSQIHLINMAKAALEAVP